MDRGGAFEVAGGGFGHAQVAHLAGGDQLGHGADGLGDRYLRVDAMQVVQVDGVDAEPRRPVNARPSSRSLCPVP